MITESSLRGAALWMATSGRMRASCFAQYGLVFTGTNDKKPWFFPRDTKRGVLLLTCPFTTNPGNCCSNSSLDLLFQNSMFLLRRDKTDETNANSCTHWHVYMNIYIWYTCVYWKSMIISHIFGMTKQLRSQPHTHTLSLSIIETHPKRSEKMEHVFSFNRILLFYCFGVALRWPAALWVGSASWLSFNCRKINQEVFQEARRPTVVVSWT